MYNGFKHSQEAFVPRVIIKSVFAPYKIIDIIADLYKHPKLTLILLFCTKLPYPNFGKHDYKISLCHIKILGENILICIWIYWI